MTTFAIPTQWILGCILVFSSLGVILARKPVHASLFFLLTLIVLSVIYLQLSAQFIAVMQVLVYAGAILVIFVYVIVLFQDAHQQIARYEAKSVPLLLIIAAGAFLLTLVFLGKQLIHLPPAKEDLPQGFGTVESLGQSLYVDFFFPFEAVILLFLIAVIGAFYIGKKGK
jgi:NADH-quinone oxidoreductase subunit J